LAVFIPKFAPGYVYDPVRLGFGHREFIAHISCN
jgi:hypothetical protein